MDGDPAIVESAQFQGRLDVVQLSSPRSGQSSSSVCSGRDVRMDNGTYLTVQQIVNLGELEEPNEWLVVDVIYKLALSRENDGKRFSCPLRGTT